MAGRLSMPLVQTANGSTGQERGEAQGVERGVERVQGGTRALAGCLSMPLVQAAVLGRTFCARALKSQQVLQTPYPSLSTQPMPLQPCPASDLA